MTEKIYNALKKRHPSYDADNEYWDLLGKLAAGGREVGLVEKLKLLICPGTRETALLKLRAEVAVFEPTMGGVITKMVSQLCRDEAVYSGSEEQWYKDFLQGGYLSKDSATGRGSFHRFLLDCVYTSLVKQVQIAQVDTPPNTTKNGSRAEQKRSGAYDAYVIHHDRSALWDWQAGKDGLTFAKLHFYREEKKSWDGEVTPIHEFLIFERDKNGVVSSSKFRVKVKNKLNKGEELTAPVTNDKAGEIDFQFALKNQMTGCDLKDLPYSDIELETVFSKQESFYVMSGGKKVYKFPLIVKRLPSQMCLGDQLFDLQVGAFNMGASGNWAEKVTNYSMPVYTPPDNTAGQKWNGNPLEYKKVGAGFYLEVPPGATLTSFKLHSQEDIRLAWEREQVYKQRMMDVVQQISTIAAASFIPQSGASKKEDRRAMDILLEVYGQHIREFAKEVLDTVSVAHNDDIKWTVQGFSDYDSEGLEESIQEYLAVDQSGIDSPTLKREIQKTLARRLADEYGLSDEAIAICVDELDKDPFHLDIPELQAVMGAFVSIAQGVPPEVALGTLLDANYLTEALYTKAINSYAEMGLSNGGTSEENGAKGKTKGVEAAVSNNGQRP